jgi:methionyl-tRNA formyltransferase
MRIGWVGFHIEGVPALEAILEQGIQVEAAITLKPESAAKRSGAADYQSLCRRHSLPLHEVTNINDPGSIELLRRMDLDLLIVLGWTQILKPETLRTAKIGVIGAHASLLPRNRGRAPVNWVILRAEQQTGNSLIWLTEYVDSGDIIDQTIIPITPYDTCASIYQRVADSNKEMLLKALSRLRKGERPGRAQTSSNEPLLPGRRPQDGAIDWAKPSSEIYNFVRALTRPYPGAFSYLNGERWLIWHCALVPGEPFFEGKPGQVIGPVYSPIEGACGQLVRCGNGAVILLELQRSNGEILAGRRLSEQAWNSQVWHHDK